MESAETRAVSAHGSLARRSLHAVAGLIYVFLFAPILIVVLFSFNTNRYGTFPITGWTLHWYSDVFNDFEIRDALTNSLKVGLQVTILSTVIGGADTVEHIEGNVRAADWKLSPDEVAELDALTA